eukprot:scaffold1804_cov263-Pinguiococcus_pyrenoidosus.AAC.27
MRSIAVPSVQPSITVACIASSGGLPAWEAAGGPVEVGRAGRGKELRISPSSTKPCTSDGCGAGWRTGRGRTGGPLSGPEARRIRLVVPSPTEDENAGIVAGESQAQIVDARPAARFNGEAPEPRPGVKQGRIPGSVNFPIKTLFADGDMTTFKSPAAIEDALKAADIDVRAKQS